MCTSSSTEQTAAAAVEPVAYLTRLFEHLGKPSPDKLEHMIVGCCMGCGHAEDVKDEKSEQERQRLNSCPNAECPPNCGHLTQGFLAQIARLAEASTDGRLEPYIRNLDEQFILDEQDDSLASASTDGKFTRGKARVVQSLLSSLQTEPNEQLTPQLKQFKIQVDEVWSRIISERKPFVSCDSELRLNEQLVALGEEPIKYEHIHSPGWITFGHKCHCEFIERMERLVKKWPELEATLLEVSEERQKRRAQVQAEEAHMLAESLIPGKPSLVTASKLALAPKVVEPEAKALEVVKPAEQVVAPAPASKPKPKQKHAPKRKHGSKPKYAYKAYTPRSALKPQPVSESESEAEPAVQGEPHLDAESTLEPQQVAELDESTQAEHAAPPESIELTDQAGSEPASDWKVMFFGTVPVAPWLEQS